MKKENVSICVAGEKKYVLQESQDFHISLYELCVWKALDEFSIGMEFF